MKFITQLFLMLILALCGTSLYANDGAAPPGSPIERPPSQAPAVPATESVVQKAREEDIEPPDNPGKTLDVSNVEDAKAKISDIQIVGNGDTFQLLCKASSKTQGWMKSCKAMEIPRCGCLVQVTTQQINPDGSSSLAEALTFVPFTKIESDVNGGRKLVNTH